MANAYVTDNVFIELGLAKLPEERKTQMLEQMNELIHKRAMLRIMDLVPQEKSDVLLQEMQGMATEQEQMQKLLQYVPNLTEVIMQEVQQVKDELIASSQNQE